MKLLDNLLTAIYKDCENDIEDESTSSRVRCRDTAIVYWDIMRELDDEDEYDEEYELEEIDFELEEVSPELEELLKRWLKRKRALWL